MPDAKTIFTWLKERPEFLAQYARAKEIQMEFYADEIKDISDDESRDFQVEEVYDNAGNVLRRITRSDNTAVNRARLRVDSRKWLMSKLAPKKFGDVQKHEHSGPEGGPIPVMNIGVKTEK